MLDNSAWGGRIFLFSLVEREERTISVLLLQPLQCTVIYVHTTFKFSIEIKTTQCQISSQSQLNGEMKHGIH